MLQNPLVALAAPDRPAHDTGVHLGRITRITPQGAWVEIPVLAPGFEYGPCRIPTDWRDWTHHGHAPDAADAEPEHRLNAEPGTTVAVWLSPAGHHLLARYGGG